MSIENIGLQVPEILLPKAGTDMKKWSVVACDQYTSQPEYWENAKALINGEPSTLELIFPEVYLDGDDEDEIIKNINDKMLEYQKDGLFSNAIKGFVLVDRKSSHSPSRKGLMVALDLEKYDYNKGAKTLIRASEGTIVERLKPRMKIRKNASLELPHIMVLIDDPEKSVIEPLFEKKLKEIYNTELMLGGGHITGKLVDKKEDIELVVSALEKLATKDEFNKKYDLVDEEVLLYAMGDGNHSFATAKAMWEQIKFDSEDKNAVMNHPGRYALVELVNMHDEGIVFEPIHRVLFNISKDDLVENMEKYYSEKGVTLEIKKCDSEIEMDELFQIESKAEGVHLFPFITKDSYELIIITNHNTTLEVEDLQLFLDKLIENRSEIVLDYVHGKDVVLELSQKDNNAGFLLPSLAKNGFFKSVIKNGALPRKAFSMGEAEEKRFYMEVRSII